MWYRFEEGSNIGIPRIKGYQVAFYDMTRGGKCFDEGLYSPDKIFDVVTYLETVEDEGNPDRRRVFVHFDNGDEYEMKLHKISKEQSTSVFSAKQRF